MIQSLVLRQGPVHILSIACMARIAIGLGSDPAGSGIIFGFLYPRVHIQVQGKKTWVSISLFEFGMKGAGETSKNMLSWSV